MSIVLGTSLPVFIDTQPIFKSLYVPIGQFEVEISSIISWNSFLEIDSRFSYLESLSSDSVQLSLSKLTESIDAGSSCNEIVI